MKVLTPAVLRTIVSFLVLGAFWSPGVEAAISVNTAILTTNEICEVTVSGMVPLGVGVSMRFTVDFGDGSPAVQSPTYAAVGPHTFVTTHRYARQGTYTIRAITQFFGGMVSPPSVIETQNVSVFATIPELPRGLVGEDYSFSLRGTSRADTTFRLVRGQLPPGLQLAADGTLSGIPTKKGRFPFTVRVSSARAGTINQDVMCLIDPGRLIIGTDPEQLNLTAGASTPQRIIFTVTQPTVAINETIRSSRGEFLVAGRVIGSLNTPLAINLNTVNPSGTETIKVPESVLLAAQQAGTSRIVYRRVFNSQNLQSGRSEIGVSLRTPAAGELRITKMRVYFEKNNRPLIVVQRNERDLSGAVEIHYNGSGTLKGYWQVDGRILQRVQQNIFYGKVLTLKTPVAPPLPTYSEGPHRLQFIITEPVRLHSPIDFPEAIYHVEAKQAEFIAPITITSPQEGAGIDATGIAITWSAAPQVSVYHVEFLEPNASEPFFTAYTRVATYQLQARVIQLRFTPGVSCRLRVKAFNDAGELVGQSEELKFSLGNG